MAGPMQFSISKVDSPMECAGVLPLQKEFLFSLPTRVIFGLPPCDREIKPIYGPEDFLIVANDREGKIIGYAANKVNASFNPVPNPSPAEIELEEFFKYVDANERKDKLPQRCIELRVLAVTEGWRGKGLARRLAEASIEAAREAGFKSLYMTCVSEFSARVARRLGWEEHYRLAYSDYPRLSGKNIQLTPNPPHDHIYCYYTLL